jgi:AraC-like DNA-binding protein
MDGLRTSEHASESGRWRIASLAPSGRLASYVDAFYAYHEQDTAFRRRRELPDGSAVLIFNLGKELRVEHPTGTLCAFGQGRGFFSGASATYAVTETDGAQTGAQIKFSLLGARLFLGRPLGELGDALVDPSEAFGSGAAELGERVAEARSSEARLLLLSQAVGRRLLPEGAIAPGLAFAFNRLSRVDVRIAEVAREIGLSGERFSRAFGREFGLSPKAFARIRRFARALRLRAREPSLNGAMLAAQCGYADQAHMVRDFQAFAGAAPAALWRRELPNGRGFVDGLAVTFSQDGSLHLV